MEFLKSNFLNTTTMLSVTNNTGTSQNVFNRDKYYQYYTDGAATDLTTASLTITFDQTTNVSRIALLDTNVKEFIIFYNGSTANTFALSSQNTSASSFINNTNSSLYLRFPTTAVSSITIDLKKTITANQEKYLGLFHVSELYYTFGQIPNASGYKPQSVPKQIVHNMSDGGTKIGHVRNKFALDIDLDYLSSSDVTSIKTIYDLQIPFAFAAFGTSTGWVNPVMFDCNWVGPFRFYEYSDDAAVSGFSGKIALRETPA